MPKTELSDRARFYEEVAPNVRFLDTFFEGNREEDFRLGMRAFVHEWFRSYDDEQSLPSSFWNLLELAAETFCWDLDEWLELDEDDDDD